MKCPFTYYYHTDLLSAAFVESFRGENPRLDGGFKASLSFGNFLLT